MKAYFCDKCKKEFGGPLDEVSYTDDHGVTTIYDLCAPCRKEHKNEKAKAEKGFFDKIKK